MTNSHLEQSGGRETGTDSLDNHLHIAVYVGFKTRSAGLIIGGAKCIIHPPPFSHLPMQFENHPLMGLHPRNESRVGFHMQTLDNPFLLSILLLLAPIILQFSIVTYKALCNKSSEISYINREY